MDAVKRAARAREVARDYLHRRRRGDAVQRAQLIDEHPDLLPELDRELANVHLVERARQTAESGTHSRGSERSVADLPASWSTSIPGYEIIRKIRHGGQGVVFEAFHEATHRRVAIKMMRDGTGSGQNDITRFQREIRILGALRHPNIVNIHDSGRVAGQFYFVMAYISGASLDGYVNGHDHSQTQLLRLFEEICKPVHAAHLRGIIHRDLKPSNILTDDDGAPHILDFGLAKIAEIDGVQSVQGVTVTERGQFVGSLPWASPEQVEGKDDIDLRTDVYSLGVILYQMLTKRFPYEVVGSVREVMDNIVTKLPVTPSKITPGIDNEIDTILLKCLSKDPEIRYQSAGALGEDIQRYLAGDVIEAKRASTLYVVKKSIRRHKIPVAIAASFILLIAGSAITMAFMYQRALRAEYVAERRRIVADEKAITANQVTACLEEMIKEFNPLERQRGDVSVREMLDHNAERIADQLRDQPEAQVRLLETIATAYRHLGVYDQASRWWQETLALRRDVLGNDDQLVASTLIELGIVLTQSARLEEADEALREAHRRLSRAQPEPTTTMVILLNHHAALLHGKRDYAGAKQKLLRALEISDALQLGDDNIVAGVLGTLAGVLHDTGEYATAEQYYQQTLDMLRRVDPDSIRVVYNLEYLGLLYKDMGDYARAEPLVRQALNIKRQRFGEESLNTAPTLLSLAKVLVDAGKPSKAEPICRKTLAITASLPGAPHAQRVNTMTLLGQILVESGRYAQAETLLRQADTIRRSWDRTSDWEYAKNLSLLGAALTGLTRYDEAEELLLKSYPVIRDDRTPQHRRTHEAIARIVKLYDAWGKPDKAAGWKRKLQTSTEE